MHDFITSPTTVTLLLLFYWVPFAVGAWFTDHRGAERTRRSVDKLIHPVRHTPHDRHAHA